MNATGACAFLGRALVGLVAAALAVCLNGCGGTGKAGAASRPRLWVYLSWYNVSEWGDAGATSVVVEDPTGVCRVEQDWAGTGADPVGNFEMVLTPAQLAELRAVVEKAIQGLNAGYPPPKPPGPGWPGADYSLRLACGDAHAEVSGPNADWAVPEPARPLYVPGWWAEGLLNKLYRATLEHPLSAIELSAASDRRSYRAGDPMHLTLTVRSVGREPVAFTPMGCRDVIDGLITVTGQLPNGEQVLAEDFPFGSSEPPQWGELTPPARADLPRVRVLSPRDTYAFRLPPLTAPQPPGVLTVKVTLQVSPRYDLSYLRYLVGAVVAMGRWEDTFQVPVGH